ncbi:MAG: RNA methyltransferase [Bdellovibrionales bacterium]|jgi:tRNA G18 (ribose-2'-O)-methylase SpoU|nr:RNA methyltransferase [Bdellovibrionales bacterium]
MIVPKYQVITSPQNQVYKDLLLSREGTGDYLLVHGLKIIEGLVEKLRLRTLIARESFSEAWYKPASKTTSRAQQAELAAELFARRFPDPVTRLIFSDALFDELDPFGVPDVIAVFDRPELESWSFATRSPRPTLLLATQNPANLGACLRSAAAFGITDVVCLKEAASPYHPRAVRGSTGHLFNLKLFRGPSIHDLTHPEIVALDLGGTSLKSFEWPENPVILIGEEGRGVPKDLSCQRVHIPMSEGVESLNAAVSAGIALYDRFLKSR